ncbi:endonuclease/exonuclease/phosphatase family protein [Actinocorallia longicatena]|uniref:Endonuclease/exonuclease/phosphatase family protein n=1 Tax=Actinocorallia longicatena TaxID=111803 RepID=A0ABP6QDD6_9ACTN
MLWLLVVPFAVWAAVRASGWSPGFRWIQLVSFTPYVAAAALVVPVLALAARRWAPALAALVVAAVLVALVMPRALADGNPEAGGPVIRVMGANLLKGRTPAADLVKLAAELRVDLLSVQELPQHKIAETGAAGLDRLLPYRLEGTRDTVLYSRFPLGAMKESPGGSIRVDVQMPGAAPFEFVAVHTCAPLGPWLAECWADSQRDLPGATPGGQVRVMAGDFNATLDHVSMRSLLATGYRDAGRARGEGLAATWPATGHRLPGIVIDHVYADRRVAILGYSVHDLPRSDHRAVFAELRLP